MSVTLCISHNITCMANNTFVLEYLWTWKPSFEKNTWMYRYQTPYLRESIARPFRGFLGPKNRVRIRIDGALDVHTKSETNDFTVGRVIVTCFYSFIVPGWIWQFIVWNYSRATERTSSAASPTRQNASARWSFLQKKKGTDMLRGNFQCQRVMYACGGNIRMHYSLANNPRRNSRVLAKEDIQMWTAKG